MTETSSAAVFDFIVQEIKETCALDEKVINRDTPLIGNESGVNSQELVMLLLAIEEWVEDTYGKEFDWTSDSNFSLQRSGLRTVGTLVTLVESVINGTDSTS